MTTPKLMIIGDRINPGFKSTKELVDANNIAGLQALAVKQKEAGAAYLDVTIGPRAYADKKFLIEVLNAIQAAVDTPLCFDDPSAEIQEVCLKAYDSAKAGEKIPMMNSIADTRWELADLLKIRPFKVIMMSNERVENGVRRQNKTVDEIVTTVRRMAHDLLGRGCGITMDDLIVDVAISAISSDTEGRTRTTLEAIETIGKDPELKGIHISGGLTNLAAQLPAIQIDGKPLKAQLENAFLTLAIPRGFDTVLATPGRSFEILPDDNRVLQAFKEIISLDGIDALRRLRKLYTA